MRDIIECIKFFWDLIRGFWDEDSIDPGDS